MKLTAEKRRLSLDLAQGLRRSTQPTETKGAFTGVALQNALGGGDPKTLAAFKSLVERDLSRGLFPEIKSSLDVISAVKDKNREAGYPLTFRASDEARSHLQSVFTEVASRRTELEPPYGINTAQVYTELLGQLHQDGVLDLGDFHEFAAPILAKLDQVSPISARQLRSFLKSGESTMDQAMEINLGRIEANKAAMLTKSTKVDGDVGGKKPASKTGPMLWRPGGVQPPKAPSQTTPPAPK